MYLYFLVCEFIQKLIISSNFVVDIIDTYIITLLIQKYVNKSLTDCVKSIAKTYIKIYNITIHFINTYI